MQNKSTVFLRNTLTAIVFTLAQCFATGYATASDAAVGQVKTLEGDASIIRDGNTLETQIGARVYAKDLIRTGKDGSIGITFTDNTVMATGPNSEVALEDYAFDSDKFDGSMLADMRKGTLLVVSGDIARSSPDAMKVRTPTAVLGVRGTRFLVKVGQGQ